MTSECVRTDWILPRGVVHEHVEVNSRFSRFQLLAFSSSGLASSMFIFAPIVLRFFFILFVYARLQNVVTDFLISTCEKSYASSMPAG